MSKLSTWSFRVSFQLEGAKNIQMRKFVVEGNFPCLSVAVMLEINVRLFEKEVAQPTSKITWMGLDDGWSNH